MGHAEMILAVAGMQPDEIAGLSCSISTAAPNASPAERAAYTFARKQAVNPVVSDADIEKLVLHFGRERAWHVIWWSSRCHYMTRVADAFQLPLEEGNPFEAMPGVRKK